MSGAKEMPDRDPLAAAMFAAWVNVPVDKVPPEFKQFNCPATMEAWLRVGRAAQAYFRSEAAIAAARAEGERIGMAMELDAIEAAWSADPAMALAVTAIRNRRAIRAAMDGKPPQPEYPSDADIDRSLSTARLLP